MSETLCELYCIRNKVIRRRLPAAELELTWEDIEEQRKSTKDCILVYDGVVRKVSQEIVDKHMMHYLYDNTATSDLAETLNGHCINREDAKHDALMPHPSGYFEQDSKKIGLLKST